MHACFGSADGGRRVSCPKERVGLMPEHEMAQNVSVLDDLTGAGTTLVNGDKPQFDGFEEVFL